LIVTAAVEEQLKAQNESLEISAMLEDNINELYVYEICNNLFTSLFVTETQGV
jgi:hypothetical protein